LYAKSFIFTHLNTSSAGETAGKAQINKEINKANRKKSRRVQIRLDG
jgi:hypothetical protein